MTMWRIGIIAASAATVVGSGARTNVDESTPTAILYDRAGVHPQCSEGPLDYMQDCVLPSDYFSYVLSVDPVLDSAMTCEGLGYEFVRIDPPFGFKLYWKGGAQGLSNFSHNFFPGHPRTAEFLNASRDTNPACAHRPPPIVKRHTDAAPTLTDDTLTYFDASGTLPQCGEGPASYMTNCVQVVDMVAYFLSRTPTMIPGSHCADKGFKFVSTDNIFPPVRLYWNPNVTESMASYFGAYFSNHTAAFGYLNATRDATTGCKLP